MRVVILSCGLLPPPPLSLCQADTLSQAFRFWLNKKVTPAARLMARCGFSADPDLVTATPAAAGVDDAVVALSLQVINSRPAAGQGWVTSADGGDGVPQLVRYALEVRAHV